MWSLGLATLYITNSISTTIAVLPTILNMFIYLDGFNVETYNVPVFYQWLATISFPRYIMELAMNVAFGDQFYSCSADDDSGSTMQCPLTGQQIVAVYGYNSDSGSLTADVLGLVGAVVALRVIAVLALYRSMLPARERQLFCWRKAAIRPKPVILKRSSIQT